MGAFGFYMVLKDSESQIGKLDKCGFIFLHCLIFHFCFFQDGILIFNGCIPLLLYQNNLFFYHKNKRFHRQAKCNASPKHFFNPSKPLAECRLPYHHLKIKSKNRAIQRNLIIQPYSLPIITGDQKSQKAVENTVK